MIRVSDFKPAWWLANPHMQTVWGSLMRTIPELKTQRERLELPDGDFVDLDWVEPTSFSDSTPLILILHGLGGSINSHYAKNMMLHLKQHGWRGVFMHYRGCSGTPNLRPQFYHSAYTADVNHVIQHLMLKEPKAQLGAVGYSLGGSILLHWLSQNQHHCPLTRAIAISVPYELEKSANKMLHGVSRLYQWHIMRSLRHHVEKKFDRMYAPFCLEHIPQINTFWEFDTHVTAPLHGFKDAKDYYQKCSVRPLLHKITLPTLMIHAQDDPFMPAEVIPKAHELSPHMRLEISRRGGHVGFIEGNVPGQAQYWLEKRIIEYFSEAFH